MRPRLWREGGKVIEREREISAVWLWARDERAQLSAATSNVALKTGLNAGSQHASLAEPQPLVSEVRALYLHAGTS